MKTLLKDMPEHMERVESNMLFENEIRGLLDQVSDWSDSRNGNVIDESEFTGLTSEIIKKVTEFINQNYTFKGI